MNSDKLIKALQWALYGNHHEKMEAEGVLIQAELEEARERELERIWADQREREAMHSYRAARGELTKT